MASMRKYPSGASRPLCNVTPVEIRGLFFETPRLLIGDALPHPPTYLSFECNTTLPKIRPWISTIGL